MSSTDYGKIVFEIGQDLQTVWVAYCRVADLLLPLILMFPQIILAVALPMKRFALLLLACSLVSAQPSKICVGTACVPNYCQDAGSTGTYACNLSPTISSYTVGTLLWFKANTANTGTASINFNGVGALTIVKMAGGITTTLADNDIRAGQWVSGFYDGTNFQMSSQVGNASGTPITFFGTYDRTGTWGIGLANQIRVYGQYLPNAISCSRLLVRITTLDGAAPNSYDVGLYSSAGSLLANIGATAFSATGLLDSALTQGSVTLPAGKYYFAFTGNDNVAAIAVTGSQIYQFADNVAVAESSSGGALPSTITPPADSWTSTGAGMYFALR